MTNEQTVRLLAMAKLADALGRFDVPAIEAAQAELDQLAAKRVEVKL